MLSLLEDKIRKCEWRKFDTQSIAHAWMDEASRYEDEVMYKVKKLRSGVYEIRSYSHPKKRKPSSPSKIPVSGKGQPKGSVCLAHGVGVLEYVKERKKKNLRAMVTMPFPSPPFRISQRKKPVKHFVVKRHIAFMVISVEPRYCQGVSSEA